MRVCVGGPSRFHIFDLARQLNRLSMLQSIYTGYPPWKVGGLPRGAIKSFPWLISPMMLSARFGLRAAQKFLQRPAVLSFDSWMSSVLGVCDVFHCLSGFGIKTHHAAKRKYGALTVCDRASSHIR